MRGWKSKEIGDFNCLVLVVRLQMLFLVLFLMKSVSVRRVGVQDHVFKEVTHVLLLLAVVVVRQLMVQPVL